MFDVRRWKHAGVILTVILFLLAGAFGCGNGEEEAINGEVEEANGEEEVEEVEEVNGEEEVDEVEETNGEEEEADLEEDDPYEEAVEIEPMQERNVVLDEDFRSVLVKVFEKEAKLVSAGDINALVYIVDRVITSDDVKEIMDLLEEKGYETVGTKIDEHRYELNISIAEELMEEKYDGDPGGNMYVKMWTAEEGEDAQMIMITFL